MKIAGDPGSVFAGWPASDREAWNRVIEEGVHDIFDDPPVLAQWATSTQENARRVVTRFIRWMDQSGLPLDQGSIAANISLEVVRAFVRTKAGQIKSSTIAAELGLLQAACEIFAPNQDWTWFRKPIRRLEAKARYEPPRARAVVHAAKLYRLGLEMMSEALSDPDQIDLAQYRSGLVIALLAAVPIRIGNFAVLEIGRQLQCKGALWTIHLDAEETKTRRPDNWQVAPQLTPYLDHYVTAIRPALIAHSCQQRPSERLWIGDSGRPIGDQVLRQIICKTTEERLGVRINPHRFRHCAASTFALEAPEDPLMTSALLGHASPQTTQKHYIVQQNQIVQQGYLRVLCERRSRIESNGL